MREQCTAIRFCDRVWIDYYWNNFQSMRMKTQSLLICQKHPNSKINNLILFPSKDMTFKRKSETQNSEKLLNSGCLIWIDLL